jgi:hypothetical protein
MPHDIGSCLGWHVDGHGEIPCPPSFWCLSRVLRIPPRPYQSANRLRSGCDLVAVSEFMIVSMVLETNIPRRQICWHIWRRVTPGHPKLWPWSTGTRTVKPCGVIWTSGPTWLNSSMVFFRQTRSSTDLIPAGANVQVVSASRVGSISFVVNRRLTSRGTKIWLRLWRTNVKILVLRLGSLHFYFRLFANGVSTHQMRACINFILQIHRQPSDASSSNKTLSDGINFLWGVSVAIEVHRE